MSFQKNKTSLRRSCIRCGNCCSTSTPSLHRDDLPLITNGFIPRTRLYTIRRGELVWDNVEQKLVQAPAELLKVKEKQGKRECVFHDPQPSTCIIYPHRPVQCRALKCWDTAEFEEVFAGPKLTRSDLIQDPVVLGLIKEHDGRCSYGRMEELVKRIPTEGETAVKEIIKVLRFDTELRPFMARKLDLPLDGMDFLLGRPLIQTIVMFGLKVKREPDGTFFLTTLSNTGLGQA